MLVGSARATSWSWPASLCCARLGLLVDVFLAVVMWFVLLFGVLGRTVWGMGARAGSMVISVHVMGSHGLVGVRLVDLTVLVV